MKTTTLIKKLQKFLDQGMTEVSFVDYNWNDYDVEFQPLSKSTLNIVVNCDNTDEE